MNKINNYYFSLEEIINTLHLTKEEKEKEYRFLAGIGKKGKVIFDGENIVGYMPEAKPEKFDVNVILN